MLRVNLILSFNLVFSGLHQLYKLLITYIECIGLKSDVFWGESTAEAVRKRAASFHYVLSSVSARKILPNFVGSLPYSGADVFLS